MIDARTHTTHWVEAIKSQGLAAYRQNEVPGSVGGPSGTPPNTFAVVHIERRFTPVTRASGLNDITCWRAVVMHVGNTISNAQLAAMRVSDALDGATLALGGDFYGPVLFELEQAPEFDAGRYAGRTQWTY